MSMIETNAALAEYMKQHRDELRAVQDAVLSGDRDQIHDALAAGARSRARYRMQRLREVTQPSDGPLSVP